jgi:AcrR family transcriptional regulator
VATGDSRNRPLRAEPQATRAPGRPAGASGDRTRERLVAVALETFAVKGFAGSSVRDIAHRARIRVSSLYHYFPSKEALYEAVLARMQDEMREAVLAAMSLGLDLREQARVVTGKFFDFLVANPAYVQLGLRHRLEGGAPFDRRINDRWLGVMDAMMTPAEMQGRTKRVDPALFIVTVDGLVHWHLANDGFYRAMLGKGLDDPEFVRRAREHVVQVVLRAVGLE